MTSPVKPWECTGENRTFAPEPGILGSSINIGSQVPMIRGSNVPPSLPPKPHSSFNDINRSSGYYGGYGSNYGLGFNNYNNGLGYNSYSGFGSPGYGGFYNGINRFGNNFFGDVESRFIQLAEEHSRPAFSSIESIVGAVGSIAMMLENTYLALTSSFRAILGVAENFGRLRSLFAQFWSAFAILRTINWLLRKLLVVLGIRTEDEFQAWAEATRETRGEIDSQTLNKNQTSSWPAILFLTVISVVPYIIAKMLKKINSTIQGNVLEPSTWENPMQALAQYDFQATSPREISFKTHQIVTVAPQSLQGNLWNSGWLYGTVDHKNVGLIPVNYIKIIPNFSNKQLEKNPQQFLTQCEMNQSPTLSNNENFTNKNTDENSLKVDDSQPIIENGTK